MEGEHPTQTIMYQYTHIVYIYMYILYVTCIYTKIQPTVSSCRPFLIHGVLARPLAAPMMRFDRHMVPARTHL